MKFTAKKLVPAIVLTVASTITFSTQATVYSFSKNVTGKAVETFSSSWDTQSSVLKLSSNFNNKRGKIDKYSFLLSGGGVPNRAKKYFQYNLDLVNNRVTITDYYDKTATKATFDNIIDIKDGSFSLSLDHSSLLQKDYIKKNYNVGYGENIGIWNFLYSGGRKVDQLDVHRAKTTATQSPTPGTGVPVSEPGTLALMGLGLLGMVGRRKLTKK